MGTRTRFGRISAFFSCGLLALAAWGCGPADQQASEGKIYGGSKVATGAWPSTVAIIDTYGMICSGTAVHPQLVISAAHCKISASRASIYVGDGKEGGSVKGQHAVSKVGVSPLYKGSDNDIAYFLLSKPLDLPEEAYVPILADTAELEELLAIGQTARLVGFGNRNGGGFGVKFEVDTKITKLTKNEIYIGGNGKDTCQGDSGGPVYGKLANGEWRVYGVTSRGGACGTGGIYGLMHANICWIQKDSGIDLNLPAGYCGETTPPDTNPTPGEPDPDQETPDQEVPDQEDPDQGNQNGNENNNNDDWWNWFF